MPGAFQSYAQQAVQSKYEPARKQGAFSAKLRQSLAPVPEPYNSGPSGASVKGERASRSCSSSSASTPCKIVDDHGSNSVCHVDGDGHQAAIEEYALGSDSEDGEWWETVEMFDIEDQYRFDPDEVAEMLEKGVDLASLTKHFCEAMVEELEECAVAAMCHSGADGEDSPQRRRATGELDDQMTPPHLAELGSESDSHLRPSVGLAGDLEERMTPPGVALRSPKQSDCVMSLMTPPRDAEHTDVDVRRRLTVSRTSRANFRRESLARDADLLRATRQSLVGRQMDECVSEKLSMVEEALAAAHKQHRRSVAMAVRRSIGGVPEAEEPDEKPAPADCMLHDRIQEAVSLAQLPCNQPCQGNELPADRPHGCFSSAVAELKGRAIKQADSVKPSEDDCQWEEGRVWIVVGGEHVNGIMVRFAESFTSKVLPVRLQFGAHIEEIERSGNRLHYRRLKGDGPNFGWVSIELPGKQLVVPLED